MNRRFWPAFLLLFGLSCASSAKQTPVNGPAAAGAETAADDFGDVYRDEYRAAYRLYVNQTIGFSLRFPEGWIITEHYSGMAPDIREKADAVKSQGGELMLIGHTLNNIVWLRITVEPASLPLDQYFHAIRDINSAELLSDSSEHTTISGRESVLWTYTINISGYKLKYREFQFARGKYNLRVTFWTLDSLFDSFVPKMDAIGRTYAELDAF